MKNIIAVTAFALATVACNKTSSGNKEMLQHTEDLSVAVQKSISGETAESNSFPYRGLDGSRAKISFNNAAKSKSITIEANGKTFELDKTGEGTYERSGVKAVAKGDSLHILQGDTTIPLVLVK